MLAYVNDSLCALDQAAGRIRQCPGPACPFWVDSYCSIAGLRPDLDHNHALVTHLLALRGKLAGFDLRSCALLPPGAATD